MEKYKKVCTVLNIEDISWELHISKITAKANRTLGPTA